MKHTVILLLIIIISSACSNLPIDERLYDVCNGDAVQDANEYNLNIDDAKIYVIEKAHTSPEYKDNKGTVNDSPLEDYTVTWHKDADKVSLILCIDETYTNLVDTCIFNQGRKIERWDATYNYSLRVATTGEELINGNGELLYGETEYECPRTAPSLLFEDGNTFISTPSLAFDEELFVTLKPFLTK